MTTRTLAKGEEFLIAGRDSSEEFVYVTGLFRATEEIDLSVLEAEFNALGREDVSLSRERLNCIDGPGLPAATAEAFFQRWLVEEGHIERVPARTLWVSSKDEIYDRPDGTTALGFTSLKNKLLDPVSDPEMTPSASLGC